MTDRFWPILGLDEGATEAEVRRAYAKQLRLQGPEADVASFQCLRAEFEAALTAARSGSPARAEVGATRAFAAQRTNAERTEHSLERQPVYDEPPPRRDDVPPIPKTSSLAAPEIGQLLSDGDLARACDRFDVARASNEINLSEESELELELARHWLTNATLDATALAAIVRRYRWDDVISGFPLGPQIVARLQAQAKPVPRAGERFIGKWNWGAFCLTPFWLMAHGLKRRGIRLLLLGLLLLIVPFGPIGILWIAIDYGKKGNALAVKHRRFTNEQQFVAVQDAWRRWGLSLGLGIPLCLGIGFALIGGSR